MDWMRYALQLAVQGKYTTHPNPMVGCVVVKDGQKIGEGAHLKAGGPHAEVYALAQANAAAQGADLYVTLEPCCHTGRTPPCTQALISAGIKRVFVASLDPNPRVKGQGVQALQEAGITVEVGLCQEEAQKQNESFFYYITHKKPFLTGKWAASLDGKIALDNGKSQWISGELSRKKSHELRAESSAVMVGAGTLWHDDPQLDVRAISTSRQPVPLIVSGSGSLPFTSKLLQKNSQALCLLGSAAPPEILNELEKRSVEFLLFPLQEGSFPWELVLHALGKREIRNVLVEGGAGLMTSLYQAGCLQRLCCFVSPKVLGGNKSIISHTLFQDIPLQADYRLNHLERLGDDVFLEYGKVEGLLERE